MTPVGIRAELRESSATHLLGGLARRLRKPAWRAVIAAAWVSFCAVLSGCAGVPVHLYVALAEPQSPRAQDFAFFVDTADLRSDQSGVFSVPASRRAPQQVRDMRQLLLTRYSYHKDMAVIYPLGLLYGTTLMSPTVRPWLEPGSKTLFYFYSSNPDESSPGGLEASPTQLATTAYFAPFQLVAYVGRHTLGQVFAIFEGCSEQLRLAFARRVEEFEDIFGNAGRVRILSDCDYDDDVDAFRAVILQGLSGQAEDLSGRVTARRLAVWLYGGDQAKGWGDSFYGWEQTTLGAGRSGDFELVPSLSVLLARLTADLGEESQLASAELIGRLVQEKVELVPGFLTRTTVEGLWARVEDARLSIGARRRLMQAAARIDDSDAIERLVRLVDAADKRSLQLAAVDSLSRIRNPNVIRPLTDLLSHEEEGVRLAALDSLSGWAGDPYAEPLFHRAIDLVRMDTSKDVRLNAILNLAQSISTSFQVEETRPDAVTDVLREMLTDPSADIRLESLYALREIEDKAAGRSILELTHSDADVGVRVAAAFAIGDLLTDELIEEAVETLGRTVRTDEFPEVREGAAYSLGRIGTPEALRLVAEVTRSDEDRRVRLTALAVISETPDKSSSSVLIEILDDREPEVRGPAAIALGRLRAFEAISALQRIQEEDPNVRVRQAAQAALKRLSASLDELIQALADETTHLENRRDAARAIDRLAATNTLDPEELEAGLTALVEAFADQDAVVRAVAVEAVGKFPYWLISQLVFEALDDSRVMVRLGALRALAATRSPGSVSVIAALMRDDPVIAVRTEAAIALGAYQDETFIGVLIDTAEGDSDAILQSAALRSAARILSRYERQPVSEDILSQVGRLVEDTWRVLPPRDPEQLRSQLIAARLYARHGKAAPDKKARLEAINAAARYYLNAAKFAVFLSRSTRGHQQQVPNVFIGSVLSGSSGFATSDSLPDQAAILLELADLHRAVGDLERAIPVYERAVAILVDERDRRLPIALVTLADVLTGFGDFDRGYQAVHYSLWRISVQEHLTDVNSLKGQLKLLQLIDANFLGALDKNDLINRDRIEKRLRDSCFTRVRVLVVIGLSVEETSFYNSLCFYETKS